MKRYIRFLNLKKALTKDFVDSELDFTSQRLLELVALSEHGDQRMTVTEAMNEDKNIKRPSIMKAIQENTIYCGFRWLLVERNLDHNIIHSIEPTKQTKIQNLGYIAKLDANKTEILNVYLDRKTAALNNGYKSSSALDNPVKNGTLANNHYYEIYDKCEEKLINNFEEQNGAPLLYKNGIPLSNTFVNK